MNYTPNYNLKKPEMNDTASIDDINENMDIVDSKLKEVSQKADGALPESSYTAKDILNKLKTVDGNGSGLDADLFKGKSVVPIANGGTGASTAAQAITNIGGVADLKECTADFLNKTDTLYSYIATVNNTTATQIGLEGIFWHIQYLVNGDKSTGGTNGYGYQIATNITGSSLKHFERYANGKSWTAWVEVCTKNNIATMINTAFQSGGVSVVKSIQRGVLDYTSESEPVYDTYQKIFNVKISTVNPKKCFVILNNGTTDKPRITYLSNITENTLSLARVNIEAPSRESYPQCGWQVIEYY